jgi:DNA-binding NarL/FixJ family response regulator
MTDPLFLIADDSLEKTKFLIAAIHAAEWDIDIETAATTEEAYDIMRKRRVDFAFMDYYIPNDNGPHMIMRLKYRNPDARIALVSSSKKDSNLKEAREAGAEATICTSDPAHVVAAQLDDLLRSWKTSTDADR